MVEGTDVVVVIGYSFDSPNQKIDEMLFELFNNGSTLQKIYIQNPSNENFDLVNRFNLRADMIQIVTKHDCTNFHVPYEVKQLYEFAEQRN